MTARSAVACVVSAAMLAFSASAFAAPAASPGPYLWTRAQLAAGGWPSGLLGDVRVQVRDPLWGSSKSFLLADSYVGAGARIAASPAFVEGGPRLSIAPAAFFDMDVQGSVHRYFDGGFGLLPFDSPDHKLESERNPRASEVVPDTAWTLSANPTLKAQVGPFVGFDSVIVEAWHVDKVAGATAPYVYEPFRDLVIAWDDVVVEHQPAALWTPWKGDGHQRMLWVGATLRDRYALVSRDHSLTLGPMVNFRPGSRSNAVPMLVLQVLPYLVDADRVGGVPCIQGALVWKAETPFKSAAATP